ATSAPGQFIYNYDFTLEPIDNDKQTMAGLTQLFYNVNWLHDFWYDMGFTEKAKNGQKSNYARGGIGNDPLHLEGQDSYFAGSRNNANMSTPGDGMSPRMQMYVWSGLDTSRVAVAT